ncbi:MAG: GyrI-like domain-containing protein [Firmicutes bacterium]|nr:GyrI-like domain-containing protein [Bacillota bacterium]
MTTKHVCKEAFAVIGKAGKGPADNPLAWTLPLWEDANKNFQEIAALAQKDENGLPLIWGAMNDVDETNKRWGETGKYMAGCEAGVDTQPPTGWTKWVIPAQRYLVVETTADQYGEVFGAIVHDENIKIVGTVHERYPQPGNPNVLEIWFPVGTV